MHASANSLCSCSPALLYQPAFDPCISRIRTSLRGAAPLTPASSPPTGPKGFQQVKDAQDGYQFLYPFGWQEVAIDGQDVVYKVRVTPLRNGCGGSWACVRVTVGGCVCVHSCERECASGGRDRVGGVCVGK